MIISKSILTKTEKEFSINRYDGKKRSKKSFIYKKGSVPILLSAPHTINQVRDGSEKRAEVYTGSIVKILNKESKCHIIYRSKNDSLDPNFDSPDDDGDYKNKVIDIIRKNNIKVFLDIHGAQESRDFDIDLGTDYQQSLFGHNFISELIKLIMGKNLILNIKENDTFPASFQHTVTKNTYLNAFIPCIQLEINKKFRDIDRIENFNNLIKSLIELVNSLKDIDYKNNEIFLYTAKKSRSHIPIDKVEFHERDCEKLELSHGDSVQVESIFKNKSSMSLFSIYRKPLNSSNLEENTVYLTNRFYKQLIEDTGASNYNNKVLVYKTKKNLATIGLPKVGKEIVVAGEELFSKLNENKNYQLYNKVDGIDIDVGSIGINTETTAPNKLFLNYFQRHLMNINSPKKIIMKYDFDFYLRNENNSLTESELDLFKNSYEKKQQFYQIKTDFMNDFKLKKICGKLDLDKIEIVEVRDKLDHIKKSKIKLIYKKIMYFMLKNLVNNIPMSMRVGRPLPTDESSDIVRLMPDTMKILGITDTDKVIIKFKDKEITLRAMEFNSLETIKCSNTLIFDEIDAFILIGIPARYRVELGIYSLNSIVSVERDMGYVFNKNLSIQLLPIVAVVFTIFQTFPSTFIRLILNLILIPVTMYIALSQERVKISKNKRNVW